MIEMGQLSEVSEQELRTLSRIGAEGGATLNLFVGFDLPEVPTARSRSEELGSHLSEAEAKLRAEAGDADGAALDACLARARDALGDVEVTDPTLHGLAVVCPEDGELRAYALRRRPGFDLAASFRRGAALEPLFEALPGPAWGAVVVNRHHGRVFRGTELGLVEIEDVEDDVHRWHAQGGWSQARFQRGIAKETRDHVRNVCELLASLHERQPFDHIVVLAPAELWPVVEDNLHPYLRERLAGHLAVDLGDADADEVLDRCGELMAEQRRGRARQVLDRLEQDLGSGERAAAGDEAVRKAIEERRVELLVVPEGSRGEAAERAVEGALAQGADVLVVAPGALAPFGEIAALLRY